MTTKTILKDMEKKEAFEALKQDDILQPYISEDDFRSSNEGDNIRYVYMFSIYDIRKIMEIANQ